MTIFLGLKGRRRITSIEANEAEIRTSSEARTLHYIPLEFSITLDSSLRKLIIHLVNQFDQLIFTSLSNIIIRANGVIISRCELICH